VGSDWQDLFDAKDVGDSKLTGEAIRDGNIWQVLTLMSATFLHHYHMPVISHGNGTSFKYLSKEVLTQILGAGWAGQAQSTG